MLLLGTLFAVGCERESAPTAASSAGPPASSPRRAAAVDNVVLITVDTLRADALGFAGNDRVSTPVLDRLAAGGRVYPNAHAHSVVTLPSHANILTGLHPYEHGVRDNSGFKLPEEIPTAATLLREAGFATAAFVAAYPLDARYGLARGFDVYDDDYPRGSRATDFVLPERSGREVVARALAWWRQSAGRRRFLWVHVFEPHAPYDPPEPFAGRHRSEPYYGEVEVTDALLAPLLEPFLDGAEPPTLVVLTSDHGEALGEHGEVTHGLFAYEETLQVPLVIWGLGPGSGLETATARHVDLLPTVLEAAGLDAPAGLPGRSLAGPVAPSDAAPAYFEALMATLSRGWAPLRGVIEGRTKFISLPIPELYDLESDPAESDNLFDARRDRARALARLLPDESVWPPRQGEVTGEERAALRSLGYLSGRARSKSSFGVEDDPKNLVELDNQVHRAVELYQQGRLDEALAVARGVLRRRPDMGSAYSALSQVLLERGETEEAIVAMERAVELEVASETLVRQLGLSLSQVGRFDEAIALLEPQAAAGDRDSLNALGVVLSEAGRHAEARVALERLLDAEPDDPVAHENLALVALRLGEWSEARDRARRALAGNPELALSWNYLGTALYNLGLRQEALDALQSAVSYDPQNWDALYNVAAVAMEVGDRGAAVDAIDRFVELAPESRYGPDIERARGWRARLEGG